MRKSRPDPGDDPQVVATDDDDVVALIAAGLPLEEVLVRIDRECERKLKELKKTSRQMKRRHRRQDARMDEFELDRDPAAEAFSRATGLLAD